MFCLNHQPKKILRLPQANDNFIHLESPAVKFTFEYGAQCLSIKFGGVLMRYSTNLGKQTNAHRLKIYQESDRRVVEN